MFTRLFKYQLFLYLIFLLVYDIREEVTVMERCVYAEVVSSTFDEPDERLV